MMAAKLEKTSTPGIFKRGSRYVFSYRVDGRQKWESARTFDEARRVKSERTTDIARGELEERSTILLHDYAREWWTAITAPASAGSARRRAASIGLCWTSMRCAISRRARC
jgi:hypothetical protein